MIEINGVVDPNAFDTFNELLKGKKQVVFARMDVKPLKVYPDWHGKESGYGPVGSPIAIGEKHAITIPMEFTTLKYFANGSHEQVLVRYYKNKTTSTNNGVAYTTYDAGDGGPAFLFEGNSIKLNVTTAEGKELFRVLMAHPSNAEHPDYGPKKPPLFRLLRPEETARKENEKEKISNKAVAMAYNTDLVPDALAIKIHKSLRNDNGGLAWTDTDELINANEMEMLRSNLASYARQNPDEFNELVGTANLGIRNTINEAYNSLILDRNEKAWFWGEKVKGNNREICKISIGEEPMDALVAFLVYDKAGKKVHQKITDEMESVQATAKLLGK